MEDEIKVGEFVRSDKGKIYRIDTTTTIDMLKLFDCQFGHIVKHSPNLIDLIQEGDYVNGCKVDKIERLTNEVIKEDYLCINGHWAIYNWNIKSIVTKEQFKSLEYIVEGR